MGDPFKSFTDPPQADVHHDRVVSDVHKLFVKVRKQLQHRHLFELLLTLAIVVLVLTGSENPLLAGSHELFYLSGQLFTCHCSPIHLNRFPILCTAKASDGRLPRARITRNGRTETELRSRASA